MPHNILDIAKAAIERAKEQERGRSGRGQQGPTSQIPVTTPVPVSDDFQPESNQRQRDAYWEQRRQAEAARDAASADNPELDMSALAILNEFNLDPVTFRGVTADQLRYPGDYLGLNPTLANTRIKLGAAYDTFGDWRPSVSTVGEVMQQIAADEDQIIFWQNALVAAGLLSADSNGIGTNFQNGLPDQTTMDKIELVMQTSISGDNDIMYTLNRLRNNAGPSASGGGGRRGGGGGGGGGRGAAPIVNRDNVRDLVRNQAQVTLGRTDLDDVQLESHIDEIIGLVGEGRDATGAATDVITAANPDEAAATTISDYGAILSSVALGGAIR